MIDNDMKTKLHERLAKLQGKTVPIEQEKEAEKAIEAISMLVKPAVVPSTTTVFNLVDALVELDKEAPFAKHFHIDWKKAMIGLKMLHNSPYEFSAVALLGYTNIATHHIYNVNSHLYGIRPSSLFVAILLQSGGLKSTIGGELGGPFNDFIDRYYEVNKDEDYR